MWDLISFREQDLSLILRGKDGPYLFAYPWKAPAKTPGLELPNERAETINLKEDRLFDELALRARFAGCLQIFKLARSGLNGSIPTSMTQIHNEALKFALRRYEKKMITSDDFVGMLRSAAIVKQIPDGCWDRVSAFLTPERLVKLKGAMNALSIFHPRDEDRWLDEIKPYMGKVLWFANEFDSIKVVAKQLAILHPDHREDFNDLGDKASSILLKSEIEAEQATQKPWQRSNAPKLKRSVRTGPSSRSSKKQQADDSEEKT
jgi:hypothetical protein